MKTLVIYELVPEDTKAYLADTQDLDISLLVALEAARGSFMGTSLSAEQEQAHQAVLLATEAPDSIDRRAVLEDDARRLGLDPNLIGQLTKFEKPLSELPIGDAGIDRVYVLGFLL